MAMEKKAKRRRGIRFPRSGLYKYTQVTYNHSVKSRPETWNAPKKNERTDTMRQLNSFPRVSLGVFPTPVQKLENISKRLNVNVYIKRDDLTGLGLGGNYGYFLPDDGVHQRGFSHVGPPHHGYNGNFVCH